MLKLNEYTIESCEEGFLARYKTFPDMVGIGKTKEEAVSNLDKIVTDFVKELEEDILNSGHGPTYLTYLETGVLN